MEFSDYISEAVKTAKPWDSKEFGLAYLGLGLAGESGEVVDMLKKGFSGAKELNIEELKKELGDVMWYIANLCHALDLDMDEVLEMNIAKLRKRHGTAWSGYGKRD